MVEDDIKWGVGHVVAHLNLQVIIPHHAHFISIITVPPDIHLKYSDYTDKSPPLRQTQHCMNPTQLVGAFIDDNHLIDGNL